MNEYPFQMKFQGAARTAILRFASRAEVDRYHRSLSFFTDKPSKIVREAVEFTRLAAKRWRYYLRSGEATESFSKLQRKIRRDPTCEVAFIMVATTQHAERELPVGLAYCRRTWCHHLALDFLALHPRALDRRWNISGVGSGIAFGLVQLANVMNISKMWGEATVNSAPFYEKLLAVQPVQDLFVIESPEMAAIAGRQQRIAKSNPPLASQRRNELQ